MAAYRKHNPTCFEIGANGTPNYRIDQGTNSTKRDFECSVHLKAGETFTILGVPITDRNAAMADGHVVGLVYKFNRNNYVQMKTKFIEEFGEPTRTDSEDTSGCKGEQLIWENEASIAGLSQCGSKAVFTLIDFWQTATLGSHLLSIP